MKKILKSSLLLLTLTYSTSQAQVFWTEDFDAVPCVSSCGLPYAGANGSWVQSSTGAAGTDPNKFYVSCAENGQAANVCGAGCGSDNSLHVSSAGTILGDVGAAYYSGDGGAGFADGTTHIRAESPVINCTGKFGITLAFNYIENGQAATDNAQLWYFNGATWSMLFDLSKTSCCSGSPAPVPCTGSNQGLWTAYSVSLPASADNNANVKIGFTWDNDNDAGGTDPSFAVDDITLAVTAPPVAAFTPSATTICTGQCITFTNTSTSSFGSFTSSWTFPGGSPSSSGSATPGSICYSTAGTYTVTLTVTDAGGTDTATASIIVNPCVVLPVANFGMVNDTICMGQCINFADSTTGAPTSWSWTFTGGSPGTSTLQNPTGICYIAPGVFTVTLVASNAAGSDSISKTLVVQNCNPPTVNFSVSDNQVCQGDCITVSNTSTNATSYAWSMPGAVPDTSNFPDPGPICFPDSSGSYTITLYAYNSYGVSSNFITITVDTVPIIEAFPDVAGISLGDSIALSAVANGPVTWSWVTIDTASIGDTTQANVTVMPTMPTTVYYYVTATDANGCTNTDSVILDVQLTDVIGIPNAFSPNNDGHNDLLKVLGPGIKTMNLVIYNRYGQKVFETSDQNTGWDGKQNGSQLDPGVFAYYLKYTLINGLTGVQKGNITLIR